MTIHIDLDAIKIRGPLPKERPFTPKPERFYACYRDGKIITDTLMKNKKQSKEMRAFLLGFGASDHPVIPVIITPEEPE